MPLATRDPAASVAEAVRLAGVREPRCGPVRLIAVDGPSGSGKSTLGAAIGAALDAPVVHMDDIYPGWDGLADAVPLVTTQVLEPLAVRPARRIPAVGLGPAPLEQPPRPRDPDAPAGPRGRRLERAAGR